MTRLLLGILCRQATLWVACLVLVYSCNNSDHSIQDFGQGTQLPDAEMQNVSFTYTQYGKPHHLLKAPKTEIFYTTNSTEVPASEEYLFPSSFLLISLNSQGDTTSVFSADSASYQRGKLMHATGHVVVSNIEGDSLFTPELFWDEYERQYRTEAPVRILQNNQEIYGVGMIGDDDFSNYRIFRTTGKIHIDEIQ